MEEMVGESEAEYLVNYFISKSPIMEENWRRLMRMGYEARVNGEPRGVCRRRQRGLFKKGWDAADEYLRNLENKVQ